MAFTQDAHTLGLATPLGENKLVLTSFDGDEGISRLFRFELRMISEDNAIAATDIVGKNVTFTVKLADDSPRFFNGHVSRFLAGDEGDDGTRNYRAEVVPALWFLTRNANCRIFQKKTVVDIIEQIFGDRGLTDYDTGQITGNHPEREYVVQYRETDFNFVARLCEEEGIFWFFKHDNGKHNLVLADNKGVYFDCDESEVDYPRDYGTQVQEDFITSWEHRYEFRTGKWTHTDWNFETPSTDLMANEQTVISLPDVDKYEFYDYPGIYGNTGDGRALAKLRMEQEEVDHNVVAASSLCKTFTPGGKFKIKEHRSESEAGKKYMITVIHHAASEPSPYETGGGAGQEYRNTFQCIPDSVTFRSPRVTPKPFVQGVQTAIIVGPDGEEIYPDEHGRVKAQFHWDREGQYDENSSCWIRVSQVHAGKGFGGIDLPRIGEEVIVDFVEGDPDRPIITGRVYHAENKPPFGLPDSKNISGLKSNSTKGGGGYNEYVMDDTKENELIREHGQYDKDSTIEHDLREHVLNDRSRDVTNDETITIGNNRTETVQKGDETITVEKGDRTVNVDTGDDTLNVKTGDQVVNVDTGDATLTIKASDRVVSVQSGNYGLTAKQVVQITGQDKIVATGNNEVNIAGKVINISAQEKIVIGVGSSTITIDAQGVKTSGPKISSTAVGQHDISGALIKIN